MRTKTNYLKNVCPPYFQIDPKTSEKTSEKILKLISDNSHTTIQELAGSIGVTERSIERNIERLKDQGKLKRIGPDKGGYWEIETIE